VKKHEVTVPQIGLLAATRAMLGAAIALLLSEKLTVAFSSFATLAEVSPVPLAQLEPINTEIRQVQRKRKKNSFGF
jgi:hypothetical protein